MTTSEQAGLRRAEPSPKGEGNPRAGLKRRDGRRPNSDEETRREHQQADSRLVDLAGTRRSGVGVDAAVKALGAMSLIPPPPAQLPEGTDNW